MTDQPSYLLFSCAACGFGSVQHTSFTGQHFCPVCVGADAMASRIARSSDRATGFDARCMYVAPPVPK